MAATHFKPVVVPEEPDKVKWTPCSPGDPDAVEKSWTDVESDELVEPALRVNDFLKALSKTRSTVSPDDIRKHEEWTNNSGMDGRYPWSSP